MKLSSYFPKNHIDALATIFTFTMIPVSYLHGVLYIAPTIWPTDEAYLSEEEGRKNITPYYLTISFMTFLFVNTYANLFLALVTDTTISRVTSPVVSQPGWFFCPTCRFYVPPRTHHCPSCQKCILKRDHHCFFVGKCIGYNNHRYFVAFLIYLTMSAIAGVVTSFIAIQHLGGFSLGLLPAFIFPVLAFVLRIMPVNFFVMVQTSIALFATLGAGGLMALQLYLVYKGQTYYEMQKCIHVYGRSPKENFRDAFGKNWWFCWLLPIIPSPRMGDGSHYPPRDQVSVSPQVDETNGGRRKDHRRKTAKPT